MVYHRSHSTKKKMGNGWRAEWAFPSWRFLCILSMYDIACAVYDKRISKVDVASYMCSSLSYHAIVMASASW